MEPLTAGTESVTAPPWQKVVGPLAVMVAVHWAAARCVSTKPSRPASSNGRQAGKSNEIGTEENEGEKKRNEPAACRLATGRTGSRKRELAPAGGATRR